jgi:hypothetical protein
MTGVDGACGFLNVAASRQPVKKGSFQHSALKELDLQQKSAERCRAARG